MKEVKIDSILNIYYTAINVAKFKLKFHFFIVNNDGSDWRHLKSLSDEKLSETELAFIHRN